MAHVELAIGLVDFISKAISKSLRVLGFFQKKNRLQRGIMKKVADVFCNISFTNPGWR